MLINGVLRREEAVDVRPARPQFRCDIGDGCLAVAKVPDEPFPNVPDVLAFTPGSCLLRSEHLMLWEWLYMRLSIGHALAN